MNRMISHMLKLRHYFNNYSCSVFAQAMMEKANGKCGICGDPYLGARDNEAGGKYALGVITKQYKMGSIINVTIELTTNHKGYFEFRLCPQNDPFTPITEECLDRHVLNIMGYGKRYMLYDEKTVMVDLQLMLPPGLKCSQCVLQWKWRAGLFPITYYSLTSVIKMMNFSICFNIVALLSTFIFKDIFEKK